MMDRKDRGDISRREFHGLAAGALAASLAGCKGGGTPAESPARGGGATRSGLNILFVFADQERYFPKWPAGLSLPAHERLERTGVRFHQHYTSAVMCTSSRAVLMTGLQTPDNRMFENCDTPWVKNLSTDIPTIGHMLRKSGYYTAYKGKWHLTREFDQHEPERLFTKEMDAYGFSDYASPGDVVGHTQGGYQFDHLIAGSAVTWLRRRGRVLSEQGKPWSLFVSLVNPHDVMYFNADRPGEKVQDTGKLLSHAARAPRHPLYEATWDYPVAASLKEPLEAPGRPRAHGEFLKCWDYVLGRIPPDEERWRRFTDYYLNCIRAVDVQLTNILNELDTLGLADRTIVAYTADHGELGGAHGLRGKGPFAYQEGIHLPFFVVHPDVRGGQDCRALTSNIDVVPTLLSLAGVKADRRGELAGRALPGKDLAPVLSNPGAATVHAAREGVLFTYSGLGTNDSALLATVADSRAAGKDPQAVMKASGFKPDLKKRGSLRTVFDGRHKLTRYFSPLDRNKPATIDELFKANDVELFDLQGDPGETVNLASDREKNRDLLLAMSGKLESLIKAEIGVDDGRELPALPGVTWTLDRMD